MAQTIKLKRSATAGSVPTTSDLDLGEVAINTNDGIMYIKKDSGTPEIVSVNLGTLRTLSNYTATAGQTTFTLNYTVGLLDVYVNGIKLVNTSDYTATNGTSVVLSVGLNAGDSVEIIAYNAGGAVNINDIQGDFIAKSYNETYQTVTSSGATTTIDCRLGNAFSTTLSEDTTLDFTNPPVSGKSFTFSLEIIQDAVGGTYSVTMPTSVKWAEGTAPVLSSTADAIDYLVFTTRDNGTTWYGFLAGATMS